MPPPKPIDEGWEPLQLLDEYNLARLNEEQRRWVLAPVQGNLERLDEVLKAAYAMPESLAQQSAHYFELSEDEFNYLTELMDQLEEAARPRRVEVVPVEVGQHDAVELLQFDVVFEQGLRGAPHREPAVHEDPPRPVALAGTHQRTVAARPASEVEQFQSWTSMSVSFVQEGVRTCLRFVPQQMPRSDVSMNSMYSATTGSSARSRSTSSASLIV